MPRSWLLMLLLLLLIAPARAEEVPAELRLADAVEEAEFFLLYPPEDGVSGVERGCIRLVAQHRANDPAFREAYWLGGEEGGPLDLTETEYRKGRYYNFHAGNMCTRAVYSMALSYLGVDVTPGDMSAMTGQRDLDPPYDVISDMVGVERVEVKAYIFDTMVENYLTDPDYSPVYVYLRMPDGDEHALLIIAKLPETSRFLVLDPSGMWAHGQQYRIYMMSFNKTRTEVVNSTFRDQYAGSQVLKVYQWRLVSEEDAADGMAEGAVDAADGP